jgi:hypothetical protein
MYDFLDEKLRRFSTKLRDDLRVEAPASMRLASSLREEIRSLENLPTFADFPLTLNERLDWLHLYFDWQNAVADCPKNMYITTKGEMSQKKRLEPLDVSPLQIKPRVAGARRFTPRHPRF